MKNVVKVDFLQSFHFNHAKNSDEKGNKLSDKLFCCCSREHICKSSMNSFSCRLMSSDRRTRAGEQQWRRVKNLISLSPLKCFGQQTNSTPENNEIPQGSSIAKLRICILRSWHAVAPVWFHRTNGQQRDALWMWSKRQPSGTNKASDWNGPSVNKTKFRRWNFFSFSFHEK